MYEQTLTQLELYNTQQEWQFKGRQSFCNIYLKVIRREVSKHFQFQ